MKRIEIEIMRSSDALNAAIDTWHKAKAGKKVTPRISFGFGFFFKNFQSGNQCRYIVLNDAPDRAIILYRSGRSAQT